MSTENLDQAQAAIMAWKNIRTDENTLANLFSKGAYFEITRDSYNTWKAKNPQFLHAYLGNYNNQLTLYGVDNITDQEPVEGHEAYFNAMIKISPYEPSNFPNPVFDNTIPAGGGTPELSPEMALERTTRWLLYRDSWLHLNATADKMTRVLLIPFNDLETIFNESETISSAITLFALKGQDNTEQPPYQMEFILWGYNGEEIEAWLPKDIVQPCPPFTNHNNFQLLIYSGGF